MAATAAQECCILFLMTVGMSGTTVIAKLLYLCIYYKHPEVRAYRTGHKQKDRAREVCMC